MFWGQRQWFEEWPDELPEMIQDGEVRWITILDAGAPGVPPDALDAAHWYGLYPNPNVLVMTDPDGAIRDWIDPPRYPTIYLLYGDLTVAIPERESTSGALYFLQEAGYDPDEIDW
ncbi:MAG: hypothetical protein KDA24_08600 [Deltaproteobacteria bacterium]|nr:hypothetical protein [Deltaproteobacteria bacterium]